MDDDLRVLEVREPGRIPLRLIVGERLPIGRGGDGLVLTDERISRHHCEVRRTSEGLAVRDLGSSNGTFLNGVPVEQETTLAPGDRILIGETTVAVDPDHQGGRVADPALLATTADHVGEDHETPPDAPAADDLPAPLASVVAAVASESSAIDLRASIVAGTLTMVFSDIVDSTALNAQLGDSQWVQVLHRHNEVIDHHLGRYQGTKVKGQGDGFLLTFPSSRHGLLFAISVQRDLARLRAEDATFDLRIRIGVHTGEAISDNGDLFGRHVNLAARLADQGQADEIVASRLVHELASPMGDIGFGPGRDVELKGFEGTHAVIPVDW